MIDNIIYSIFLIAAISAIFGGLIMKFYIGSTKKLFESELKYYSRFTVEFISRFQDDSLKLGQNNLKIQDKFDENFQLINQKILILGNNLEAINSKINTLKKLENEIVKYKKIIKRLEMKNEHILSKLASQIL